MYNVILKPGYKEISYAWYAFRCYIFWREIDNALSCTPLNKHL